MPSISEMEPGTLITEDKCRILFGNINGTLESIKDQFPSINWARIKQVHGDVLVHSTEKNDHSKTEADAHWTKNFGLGLVIATADCLPICLYSKTLGKIAAIHAGWKGIANQIALKCMNLEFPADCRKDLKAFIGPHILQESFEISEDVFNILKIADPNLQYHYHKVKNKYYVDLAGSLIQQIKKLGIQQDHIFILDKDTKTNSNYHSYRRDKEKSGRNLTAIWLER